MLYKLFSASSIFLLSIIFSPAFAQPDDFSQAKVIAKNDVYFDKTQKGTLYCGCPFEFKGRSGGVIDLESCGYKVRKNTKRAQRLEWEHIVPASNFGKARQCWQNGGRKNCSKNDPVFSLMEADLYNLAPAVGEVNGDRSNFNFNQVQTNQKYYGQCDFKVDFKQRAVEPRDEVKGMIARTYFYMHDRYQFPMSKQQEKLFIAWDKKFPVSSWERERALRIAKVMNHNNPFVFGEKQWKEGDRSKLSKTKLPETAHETGSLHGNKRSKKYHLAEGCPSYNQVSSKNLILFKSEKEAISAGYSKAGNCK
ncbi:endonuclease [Vibrio caribbeanicus]|uniref:endonuclease n=1 Tax=Vibrio caribbeanicus TaxID=701175 RepID=UPI0030DCC454